MFIELLFIAIADAAPIYCFSELGKGICIFTVIYWEESIVIVVISSICYLDEDGKLSKHYNGCNSLFSFSRGRTNCIIIIVSFINSEVKEQFRLPALSCFLFRLLHYQHY